MAYARLSPVLAASLLALGAVGYSGEAELVRQRPVSPTRPDAADHVFGLGSEKTRKRRRQRARGRKK